MIQLVKKLLVTFLILSVVTACTKDGDGGEGTMSNFKIVNNSSDLFTVHVTNMSTTSAAPVFHEGMRPAWNYEAAARVGDKIKVQGYFTAEHFSLASGGAGIADFDTTISVSAGTNLLQAVPDPKKFWGLRIVNNVTRADCSNIDIKYELEGQTRYAQLMRNPLPAGKPGGTGCVAWFSVADTKNWKNLRAYYTYQTMGPAGAIHHKEFEVFQNAPQSNGNFPAGQANYYLVTITD